MDVYDNVVLKIMSFSIAIWIVKFVLSSFYSNEFMEFIHIQYSNYPHVEIKCIKTMYITSLFKITSTHTK